ncbi:isopeptide-forming domain-containing fimbrial protein [Collinsella sp. AF31-11]|uniref:isopeptide-forming domain-containing fimbrial protein n=1 Tax=Collinsella sp. AF31-11 TaxID=2292011 RepID=UPI001314148A|nr:isopeptide-forming domain-containing fimbrial protein [Collinsella sp. AF31-11]
MEFKQKAEEKKMSMSKNIARLAVTAGLTAALSFGGVMAPVTMAFAADGDDSITITQSEGNASTTFKAYQIFTASVVDEPGNSDKVVSNVDWAADLKNNEKAKTDIINAIKGVAGGDSLPQDPSAQDIADWLSDKNHVNTSTNTRLDKDHVLNKIAKAIIDNNIAQTGNSFKAGELFNATSNGYYLFVTDKSSLSTAENAKANTGTSPIFAVVGGKGVTVAEKTKIPTIKKEILNDSAEKEGDYTAQDGWTNVADSQVGQEVSYKLTGSIADNYATYDSYAYKFTDTLSQGLTYVDGSLEVYALNDENYTKISQTSYTLVKPTEGNNALTVNFDNEKGLKSATADSADDRLNIGAETQIVVFYKAKLNSKASYEVPGNTNEVYLEYSNNPMAEGTGKSTIKTVTDHVFRLDVTKVDSVDSSKKLKAGFKVKVVANEDTASVDKWLKQDGSLTNLEKDAYEFMTDGNGEVRISGLDAGKYQITETTTPSSYNTIAPFNITVDPTYDADGTLTALTVTDDSDMVDKGAVTGAAASITVKNKKGSGLPLTGLNGVTFTWIAGSAVLCIGVAHLIRSRKQAEESEQE